MKRKQRKKQYRPRRVIHKSTINIDVNLFESLRKRSLASGETITDILLNAARRDTIEWERRQKENLPDIQTTYDNKLTTKIIDNITGIIPVKTSASIIVSTCDKFGVHPNNLRKPNLTTEFINDIIIKVKQIYDGDLNNVKTLESELKKLKYK